VYLLAAWLGHRRRRDSPEGRMKSGLSSIVPPATGKTHCKSESIPLMVILGLCTSYVHVSLSLLVGVASVKQANRGDLTGLFCTGRIERLEHRKEPEDAEKAVYGRANCGQTTADRSADGSGQNSVAGRQGSRDHRSDLLPLAKGVRRFADRASQEV